MIKLNLQMFAKSYSGSGGGGTGSSSVSKYTFSQGGGSGGGRSAFAPKQQTQTRSDSAKPAASGSKGGEYVRAVSKAETYKVYSVRDRKETYIANSSGSDIMNELRYDSHNNVWRDKDGKKYKIRKGK